MSIASKLLRTPQGDADILWRSFFFTPRATQSIRGAFFGILTIPRTHENGEAFLDELLGELQSLYSKTPAKEEHTEQILERMLQKLNDVLIKQYPAELLRDLSSVVGLWEDTNLSFSQRGELKTHLLHDDANTWSLINIIEGNSITSEKPFASVASGTVGAHDRIVVAPQELFELVDAADIAPELGQIAINDAHAVLDALLPSDAPSELICMLIGNPDGVRHEAKLTTAHTRRIHDTKPLDDENGAVVTDGASADTDEVMEDEAQPEDSEDSSDADIAAAQPLPETKATSTRNSRKAMHAKAHDVPSHELRRAEQTDTTNSASAFAPESTRLELPTRLMRTKTNRVSRVSAIVVLLLIISVSAIVHSVVITLTLRTERAKQSLQATTASQVAQELEQAQAALLYNNSAGAVAALGRARTLLDTLNATAPNAPETQQLSKLLSQQEAAVYGLRTLDVSTLITAASAPEGARTIVLSGSNTYLWGQQGVWLVTGADTKQVASAKDDDPFVAATGTDDGGLLVASAKSLQQITQAGAIEPRTISGGIPSDLRAILYYNNRLYALTANAIIRYTTAKGGYTAPTPWLATNTTLTNAVSLTIDGAIYVTTSNGVVSRYNRGTADATWSLTSVKPEIKTPLSVQTTNDLNSVVLADKDTQRVLLLDKTGKVSTQWQSEAFANIASVWYDGKAILVLANGKLYKFAPGQ